jgi:hypothetical protein
MLEATDDTDDSATDFKLAAPDPHSNGDTGSSPSSSASPSPTPTANPPHIVEHQRSISFDLSGSLTATGKVKASDGYAKCVAGVAVKIQSRAMNGWKTVASTHTKSSGAYRTHIADSPGTYRAKAPSFRADENNQCGAATSKARHHS